MTILDDCRLKAVRAQKHLDYLRVELAAWMQRDPYKVDFDVNPDDELDIGVQIRVNEEPPTYLGAIFGDFLNNCRAILDYITTRLDLESGGSGERVYFPIYPDAVTFKDKTAKRFAKFDPSHLALIESVQPFNGTRRPIEKPPRDDPGATPPAR